MKGKIGRPSGDELVMSVRTGRDTYSAVWLDNVPPEVVAQLKSNDDMELPEVADRGIARHVRRDVSFEVKDVQHGLSRDEVEKILSPYRRPATGGEQPPT